ncbi:hypothetical protein E0H51_30560 [Rhizobium leguminosarum bv. viciae]|uniref:hypothetical protein n=1 Tax=Rhizobium leguminosarum TaxID=384 RepID=UPI00103A4D48|nr:hypothetical protein [Rhizobium leguminosarum]TBY69724.1 hypothetical protein E0H51_30560 [Rhizobium leguminosarum bv. viciae]
MTGTPTVVDIWPVLLPVIIGGTFGLLGGLINPLLSHYFGGRRARKDRRIQQFEAMINGVYEYDEWLEKFRRANVFSEAIEPGPSPMNKINAIALLHFRQLLLPVQHLNRHGLAYQKWIGGAGVERAQGGSGREGFTEAARAWIRAQDEFLDIATKYWTDRNGVV